MEYTDYCYRVNCGVKRKCKKLCSLHWGTCKYGQLSKQYQKLMEYYGYDIVTLNEKVINEKISLCKMIQTMAAGDME